MASDLSGRSAILAPLLGRAAQASRRRRLADRARGLHKLADDIEEHDKAGAANLRVLAAQVVQQMVELERQSLGRRFDPAAPFVYLLFIFPVGLASFFAWKYSGWWTWPVLLLSALWAVLVLVAAWQHFWQEREAAEHAEETAGLEERVKPEDGNAS